MKRPSTTDSNSSPSSRSPYKRPKHAHIVHPSTIPKRDPPLPTYVSPRVHRTSIGPTPQKDGQILGLFDQLPTTSGSQTPLKRKALGSVRGNTLTTPCKRPRSNDQNLYTDIMHQKSPLSGTKGKTLSDVITPSIVRATDCSTPASRTEVSKLRLDDTPAFLRRDGQRADMGKENLIGEEQGVSWSPIAIHRLPKAAGRGLSALLRGLREMEDEGLDEELDMLREMESESAPRNIVDQSRVLVNDSQRPEVPLGPDGSIESDKDAVEYTEKGKGEECKPLKVWQKKGQKRTTRRVLMKPSTAKWKPEPVWRVGRPNEDDEDSAAETQVVDVDRSMDWKDRGCNDDDFRDVRGSGEVMKARIGSRDVVDVKSEKTRGSAKKAKKKLSATTHANFRALNIKNKQSQGKKGGRFGRKR